ncbi:hypothetical protein [Streptomyces sp. MMS24-I29]|uniref:hypothetical protein n=1 Tax=Streptomyces sp. MMS24-I29 TaxID=3351480 RepID=UPI003C7E488E
MPEERTPHGKFGFVTCVPNPQFDDNEFWDNVRHALVGLVPLRIWELRTAGDAALIELSRNAAAVTGSRGDQFQFPQRRRSSGVLAELATGFAAAARLADGGITALGVHACFYPHEGCPKNKDQ